MPEDNAAERIIVTRPVSVPGTELLLGYRSSRLWRVFHETYTFCSCDKAAAGWRYRNKDYVLGDGGSMLMEPGETHCNTAVHQPADFKVLLINPEVFIQAAKELGVSGTPHLRLASTYDPRLFASLYRFCAAVEAGETVLEQQSRFAACVRLFLGYAEQRPPAPADVNAHQAVECAKRYLQERYSEPVTLDELTALTGLSRFHLVRTFTKHIGMPPHTYQIGIRIERARALLKAGVPPAGASTDVGFADQSHFTRHFRRVWGITPSAYARAWCIRRGAGV